MWPCAHDPQWTRYRLSGSCEPVGSALLVRRFTVPLPRPITEPFSVAFFSDLHWDGEPAQRLRRLVATVNAAQVDVVLFGGDLAGYLCHLPGALCQLAALKARRACLAVRGNRESACAWLGPQFWRERYAQAGFLYLQNDTWSAGPDPGLPAIVGVDDQRHGTPDFTPARRAAEAGRAVLTLTHNPAAVGCQPGTFLGHLLLSGHTHGGQYRLPGLGALFTSSRFWRQFDHGWRRRADGALLYITSGAGETGYKALRRRIFCPPELVFFSLVGAPLNRVGTRERP
jgi:predicted MPP superfamily phosphohydrolase